MPRKSRKIFDKILCHNLVQGINKEEIFFKTEDKEKYWQLLNKYYLKFDIEIIAYCIMSNHVHILLYSEKIQNISEFMRQVNTIYAMNYNKNKNRVGYVFRDRFKSVPIMSEKQLYTCIKYIHMNPVKAGIVQRESDYLYSSYRDYLNQTGFINEKILEKVFHSYHDYCEIFPKIEYQDLKFDIEKVNSKDLLEDFIRQEDIDVLQLSKSKYFIQKFIQYLEEKGFRISKTELAKQLMISRDTLYRRLL